MPAALTLESLQLVDAIARRGSFAAAAKELGRVPSAVTHAVRRLEDELDVLLFDRRGYRAKLTPAGEELLREGRHLLAAADDLARRVQRVAKGWEQELRIALDTIVPFERLLPLLADFCAAAPTQLRISHEVLGGSWDALVAGRADLALGASGQSPEHDRLSAGCRSLPLGQAQFVFAVAPAHPLASMPEPLPLAELRRQRQIVVGDTSQHLAPRTAGLLGVPDLLTVPTMEAKIAAQVAGLGVGFLPEHLARAQIAAGTLVVKRTEHGRSGQSTPLFAAWRTDARGKALDWWLAALKQPEVQRMLAQ
jgi:DNA-binding transcriptional LysR family regulator